MLTLTQAKQHLQGIRNLAVERNRYLACVTDYLRFVKVDIIADVRGDQFKDYQALSDLANDIQTTERVVKEFFQGA